MAHRVVHSLLGDTEQVGGHVLVVDIDRVPVVERAGHGRQSGHARRQPGQCVAQAAGTGADRHQAMSDAAQLADGLDGGGFQCLGQPGQPRRLAAGLSQVLDDRRYSEIIVTRVTVPVGEDIGFLPGTEEEKMGPWMGALDDNLEVLARTDTSAGEWGRAATQELVRSKIKIKSLNFMRGRTFLNKFVIIDEAQNLTPKQMKTLITRAGPGTKIVCLGNLAQIDTPYLTEGSSGLTYAVDRFKGWPHGGHVTLARGERSRLADFASEVL